METCKMHMWVYLDRDVNGTHFKCHECKEILIEPWDKPLKVRKSIPNSCNLPNGARLYWKDNEVGGRTYLSDEIANGVVVWDTTLVNKSTLREAIRAEEQLVSKCSG